MLRKKKKSLVELLEPFIEKADIDNDYGANNDQTVYDQLKEKLETLKKYKDGSGKEKTAYTSLTSDEQTVINELITELGTKVDKMKEAIDKQKGGDDGKPTGTEQSFWKTPLGIATILGIALAVVAVIAYFIKTNTSEDGEGE